MYKFRLDQYLAFVVLCLVFLFTPTYAVNQNDAEPQTIHTPNYVQVAPVPIFIDGNPTELAASISAQAAVVIDVDSGAVLFDKNSQYKLSPASTTKMMTALVARKVFEPGQQLEVKRTREDIGHTIGFIAGEKFIMMDLLKALLINSGNDAAEVLAENHPQGEQAFINEMNALAEKYNLSDTNFMNPSGLDAGAHYSTAFDLSILAREMMKDAVLRQIVGTDYAQINDNLGNQFHLYNTNLLLGVEPGVIGVKTGTTDLAGEALVTELQRDDRDLMIVILKSDDRYVDTKKIIDWIFSHYQWHQI